MHDDDPVTEWIDQLRLADNEAAEKLWNHFIGRLCESARSRIKPQSRTVYDEDDAALSAFWTVCSRVAGGRYPELEDRSSLWRLLLVITARKVLHRHRYDNQLCRDVRRNVEGLIFTDTGGLNASVDRLPNHDPSPEFAAELQETYDSLVESLDDHEVQHVVTLRMEGYSDAEIAKQLNCSRRTVQRRVEIIRRHWQRMESTLD